MAKKLSKISKEFKVGISILAEFLNNNGYDCEESPNEKIPEEAVEFLRNNISSYLESLSSERSGQEIKEETPTQLKVETPVEIKLIDRVSKHKLLIENIIGFTEFQWEYTNAKFHGVCSQPVKFTVFDEIISKILLVKDMSLTEIGEILGLNVHDEAEKAILLSAISDLKNDKMLEGDESYYWLTDLGKEYAKNGVKFSTFERDFDLYIDSTTGFTGNCRKIFEGLKSQKQNTFSRENLPKNIDEVKPLAEIQAPEIHFPEKKYILQSCQPTGIEGYQAPVWVVLLENFREQTIRALVYDEEHDCIVEELSQSLSANPDLMKIILDRMIDKDKDSTDGISYTEQEKDSSQIETEASLIAAQEEYNTAISQNDVSKAEEISKNIISSKRHFNSVEFEVELKRLFEETKCDLWIISPWVKNATFKRIPFFEQYLKKGGRIFVAYSKSENGGDDVMAYEEPLNKLKELEKKYHNFYLHQLEPFHFKYVWVKGAPEGSWFYSGSFNILSFYVGQGYTKVRQEMMTKLDWGDEEERYCTEVLTSFSEKYLEEAKNALDNMQYQDETVINRAKLQAIKALNFVKLKPFVGKVSDDFDKEFNSLQEQKETLYELAKLDYFRNELSALTSLVSKYSIDTNLSIEKKREVQAKLNTLKNEFPDNLEEMVDVQEKIDSLKVRDLSKLTKPRQQKGKYKKKR